MVANEYAMALFDLALTQNKLDQIASQYEAFIKALDENPDYLKIITYPSISLDKKKESIKAIGASFDSLFIDFLFVLLDKHRMELVKEIYKEFKLLLDNKDNIIQVEVVSASKLSQKQMEDLKQSLSVRYAGKTLAMSNVVDSSLIGGIKITANGKALDVSLKTQLERMKSNL